MISIGAHLPRWAIEISCELALGQFRICSSTSNPSGPDTALVLVKLGHYPSTNSCDMANTIALPGGAKLKLILTWCPNGVVLALI